MSLAAKFKTVKAPDGSKVMIPKSKADDIKMAEKYLKLHKKKEAIEGQLDALLKEELIPAAQEKRARFNTLLQGVPNNTSCVSIDGWRERITLAGKVYHRLDKELAREAQVLISNFMVAAGAVDTEDDDIMKLLKTMFVTSEGFKVTPKILQFINLDLKNTQLKEAQKLPSNAVTADHSKVYTTVTPIRQDDPLESDIDYSEKKVIREMKKMAKNPEEMTSNGTPRLAKLRERLGYNIDRDSVFLIWNQVKG